MSTTTAPKTVREAIGTEAGEYVYCFGNVEQVMDNGSARAKVVITKDEKDAKHEAVTLWLNKGDKLPANMSTINAMIERTKVTTLANGREFYNADVRVWVPSA